MEMVLKVRALLRTPVGHCCCIPDIAVGSPYESNANSDDTGAVYIYYGKSSTDGLISMFPDQVSYMHN